MLFTLPQHWYFDENGTVIADIYRIVIHAIHAFVLCTMGCMRSTCSKLCTVHSQMMHAALPYMKPSLRNRLQYPTQHGMSICTSGTLLIKHL